MAEFVFFGDFAFPNLAGNEKAQEQLAEQLKEALIGELAPYVKIREFVTDFQFPKINRKIRSIEKGKLRSSPIPNCVQILLLPEESIQSAFLNEFLTRLLKVPPDSPLELECITNTRVYVGGKQL